MNNMTDKQLEVIMNLVADKFEGCKDMDEVKKAIKEVREMAKRKRLNKSARGLKRAADIQAALFSQKL